MVMRVFVAGGTGVLGRRLVAQLVARGHQVTATTTSAAKLDLLTDLPLYQGEQGLFSFWPGGLGDVQLTAEFLDFLQDVKKAGKFDQYAGNGFFRVELPHRDDLQRGPPIGIHFWK